MILKGGGISERDDRDKCVIISPLPVDIVLIKYAESCIGPT